jgi:hypothetical protein
MYNTVNQKYHTHFIQNNALKSKSKTKEYYKWNK